MTTKEKLEKEALEYAVKEGKEVLVGRFIFTDRRSRPQMFLPERGKRITKAMQKNMEVNFIARPDGTLLS